MFEINVDELKIMLDNKEDIFLLDCRQEAERGFGVILPDVLIPMHEIQLRMAEIPKDKKIIVYCRSGNRSGIIANFLRRQNIDAYNLAGGILAWKKYDPNVVEY